MLMRFMPKRPYGLWSESRRSYEGVDPNMPQPINAAADMSPLHKPKILIIDDDPMLCDMLADLFTDRGFEAECRHDGGEAAGAVWDFHPDILVIDSVLPHTPGVEVVKQIRAVGLIRNLPIVVISGVHGQRPEQTAMRAGANAFLRKPFDLEDIVALVQRLLAEVRPAQ